MPPSFGRDPIVGAAAIDALLGGPRQRATLAILLLAEGRVVPVDRLADELYAGRPPVTAVTQVQRQVSDLRKALGSAGVIETRPPGYVLRVRSGETDLARFESLAAEATQARTSGDAGSAANLLREALALWRGPALADLQYETFAQAAAERLEELRLAVLEERIDADLALGRHATLAGELDALVADHPLRENLHARRMLALYRSGRQAEALDATAMRGARSSERSASSRPPRCAGSNARSSPRTHRSTSAPQLASRLRSRPQSSPQPLQTTCSMRCWRLASRSRAGAAGTSLRHASSPARTRSRRYRRP